MALVSYSGDLIKLNDPQHLFELRSHFIYMHFFDASVFTVGYKRFHYANS